MDSAEAADRRLGSFQVGETASVTQEITSEEVERFSQLSGDRNPLHTDPAYAATTRYGRPIAHGLLVAAPISALAGHKLPGKQGLLLETRLRFHQPVYAGDRLTYSGTLRHLSKATRVLQVEVRVTNQNQTEVLTGSYQSQLIDPEAEDA